MLQLVSPVVTATVSATAAMLVDAAFDVGGSTVSPFEPAPWVARSEPVDARLPGHVRVLGAEFIAVPFGSAGRPPELDPAWSTATWSSAQEPPHGLAADCDWQLLEQTARRVVLGLHPVDDGPLHRLRRSITVAQDRPVIDFELLVESRADALVPLALHPVFRLPAAGHRVRVRASAVRGFTYPGRVHPLAVSAPWREFDDLSRVPARGGGTLDLSRLPLSAPLEEVLLLTEVISPVELSYEDDSTVVRLAWDRRVLPSLQLWISDRALDHAPWSGRYRGLGVEPCVSAFDLPPSVSTHPNPLTARGVRTALKVSARRPIRIRSRVSIHSRGSF